jgi:hypothetical protein
MTTNSKSRLSAQLHIQNLFATYLIEPGADDVEEGTAEISGLETIKWWTTDLFRRNLSKGN